MRDTERMKNGERTWTKRRPGRRLQAARASVAQEGVWRGTRRVSCFTRRRPLVTFQHVVLTEAQEWEPEAVGWTVLHDGRFRGVGHSLCDLWSSLFVNQVGTFKEPWCSRHSVCPKGTDGRAGPARGLAWASITVCQAMHRLGCVPFWPVSLHLIHYLFRPSFIYPGMKLQAISVQHSSEKGTCLNRDNGFWQWFRDF